jgi:hypothetical protein
VVHAQVVVEQRRDPPFESVEFGECVLSDRDQEARAEARVRERARQLGGERLGSVLCPVIEEVFLELVRP